MQRSSAVKVGVLFVISLSLLVFVLIWLSGRSLVGGEQHTVLFKDVDGMREGAPVQIMGIRVGFVDRIQAVEVSDKYYVEVGFSINDATIEVPEGSKLAIEQSGIIGEKFLEITPPQLQEVSITTFSNPAKAIEAGLPVKFLYQEGLLSVGAVEKVDKHMDENLVRHKLFFRITRPGALLPRNPIYELVLDDNQEYFLRIISDEPVLTDMPDKDLIFTVENPLRIKRFLEIQLDSAEALTVTNEKISELLSDETIATLNNTLKNTEVMTARATEVLDSANALFQSAGHDLAKLVETSDMLAKNVTVVSENVNELIGDPKLKQDVVSIADSLESSSKALSDILDDPALKETLAATRDTSRDAAVLVAQLKKAATDEDLQQRLDSSITTLNDSLTKLSEVLGEVDTLMDEEDASLREMIQDTKETTENMKEFSEKLNGRFLLFRLLF
ncbi:MAG: MCE family protein [Vampirovibrio sp.]|nr:MCE family protein [Vampirovibrio sp.]